MSYSNNGPSAHKLGILLPGFRVTHAYKGEGRVILPSGDPQGWPADSVLVRWDEHGEMWVPENEVKLLPLSRS